MFDIIKGLGGIAISLIGALIFFLLLALGSFIAKHWEVILAVIVVGYFLLHNANKGQENLTEDDTNILSQVARKFLKSYDRYKFLGYTIETSDTDKQKAIYLDTGCMWKSANKRYTFMPMIMIEQSYPSNVFIVGEILTKIYLKDDGIHVVYIDLYDHHIDLDMYVIDSRGKYAYDANGRKEIFSTDNFKIKMYHKHRMEETAEAPVISSNDPSYAMLRDLLESD